MLKKEELERKADEPLDVPPKPARARKAERSTLAEDATLRNISRDGNG